MHRGTARAEGWTMAWTTTARAPRRPRNPRARAFSAGRAKTQGPRQIKRHGRPYCVWKPSGERVSMKAADRHDWRLANYLRPSNREAVSLVEGSEVGSRAWKDAPRASTGPGTGTASRSRGPRTTDFHRQGGRRSGIAMCLLSNLRRTAS